MATVPATLTGYVAPPSQSSSWRIGTRITNALNTCIIFDLFDEAIANILCLKTYTHGTSPKNYHNIMKIGVDPSYGGNGGENAYFAATGNMPPDSIDPTTRIDGWNCKNRFFVYLPNASAPNKYFSSLVYSYQACLGENTTPHQYRTKRSRCIRLAALRACSTPTLKFRLAPNNPIKFTIDNTTPGQTAGYTEQPMSANTIGLYGSLHEGMNSQWLGRIKQNPQQFRRGLLTLAAAVALVALVVLSTYASPFHATLLAIYGIVKGVQFAAQIFVPLYYQFKAKPLPASALATA